MTDNDSITSQPLRALSKAAQTAIEWDRRAQEEARGAPIASGSPLVRACAEPFVRRRVWIWGFLGALSLNLLYDLVFRFGWMLLLDAVFVASAWSLFQAMRGFESAAASGRPADLAEGLRGLMRYIIINAVMGWVVLLLMALALVATLMLMGSALTAFKTMGGLSP